MKIIAEIFRSPREEGMYLYVNKEEGLQRVPEVLLQKFGKPQSAMVLVLTPDKRLARAEARKVIEAIIAQGYYLQLPPLGEADEEMHRITSYNSKLSS